MTSKSNYNFNYKIDNKLIYTIHSGSESHKKPISLERALTRKVTELQHLGKINSKIFKNIIGLYDTGATIDVMNYDFAKSYFDNAEIKLKPRKLNVSTASGDITLREYVETEIWTNGRVCHSRFYLVRKLPFDIIIGRNSLTRLGFKLIQFDVQGNIVYPNYIHKADLSHLQLDENDKFFDRIAYPIQSKYAEAATKEALTKLDVGDIPDKFRNAFMKRIKTVPYAQHEMDLGTIPNIKAQFPLKEGAQPFHLKHPYNMKPEIAVEAKRQIDLLLKAGYIKPSVSPWAHGVTFAQKKTGDLRICFDYRPLNLRIHDQRGVMPKLENLLARFKGKKYISSLDLKSGYWHIPVDKKDVEKTAFLTPWGLYEWLRLPFGIKTAPIIFQNAMSEVFKGLEDIVLIYLDDICILSESLEEHEKHLEMVFKRLEQYNIKLRLDKCEFYKKEITYLGYRVNSKTIKPTRKYIGKIMDCKIPTTKKEVEAFLGLVIWIIKFLPPNITQYLQPLYQLTHKNQKWYWGDKEKKCFDKVKRCIESIQQIHLPDLQREFFIETDASYHSLGAVLMQKDSQGNLYPIEWLSHSFSKQQINWDIGEKECFAVIYAIEKWSYFLNSHFTVFTDHQNLVTLFNHAKMFRGNKFWRWALRLQEYSFEVISRPGTSQVVSDYLSPYVNNNAIPKPKVIKYVNNKGKMEALIIDTHIVHNYYKSLERLSNSYPKGHKIRIVDSIAYIEAKEESSYYMSLATYLAFYNQPQMDTPISDPQYPTNNYINSITYELYTLMYNSNEDIVLPIQKSHRHKLLKTNITKLEDNESKEDLVDIGDDSDKIDCDDSEEEIEDTIEVEDYINWVPYVSNIQTILPPIDFVNTKQREDPIIFQIIRFFQTGNNHHIDDLPKYIKVHIKHCSINNQGTLLYNSRIYCPPDLRLQLVQFLHEQYFHVRSTKMERVLNEKYFWPGMKKDIQNVLDMCKICYRTQRNPKHIRSKMKLFPATRVFEVVHIDLVGPFKETHSGYKYILTMCDRLSRYLEMVPLKDMTAPMVTQAFINNWLARYGLPEALISDQGSQFESYIFHNLLSKLRIAKKRTTAYRPQTNGRLERMHREIKRSLRAISAQYGLNFSKPSTVGSIDDWTQYLPIIQYRLNTTPSAILKCAPIELILGFKPKLPENIAWALDSNKQIQLKHGADYLQWLKGAKESLRKKAIKAQAAYEASRKRFFDRHIKDQPYHYKVGDKIFYRIFTANKLEPMYSPVQIIIGINDQIVTVIPASDPTAKPIKINVDRLFPCNPDVTNKIDPNWSLQHFPENEKELESYPPNRIEVSSASDDDHENVGTNQIRGNPIEEKTPPIIPVQNQSQIDEHKEEKEEKMDEEQEEDIDINMEGNNNNNRITIYDNNNNYPARMEEDLNIPSGDLLNNPPQLPSPNNSNPVSQLNTPMHNLIRQRKFLDNLSKYKSRGKR